MRARLVLLLAVLLAACAAPASQPGRVSFMISGDAAEKATYDQLVAAFAERHPNIAVSLVHIPGQSDFRKRLGADFAAGTPPDIVLLNYRRYAAYAARDAFEPLGLYLERSQVVRPADFYQQSIASFTWNGTLMCIPQNLSSLVVYYNKNLFDRADVAYPAAGWSWADFLTTAKALTKDANGDGTIDQYGLGSEVTLLRAAPFIWQNGGELVDDAANPARLAIDSPEALEAVRWFAELQTVHHVAPDAAAEEAESSESRFLAGTTAMFLNSRRGVPTYRTITAFDWDIAPLPQGHRPAGVLHADGYCMAKASTNKQAAWTFVEFANSPEGQRIMAGTGRTVPSLRSVAESTAFLDPNAKPAGSRVFLDVIADVRAVPVMATWPDIEDVVGEELERAFYGRASVEEAVTAAVERTRPFFEP
jgi:multiple sugar transport system substrate-binding protein